MIWYLDNPQRFRHEREALERLASTSACLLPGDWRFDSSLRLVWDAEIVTSSRTYSVTLQYPNHFPHSPALVLPRGTDERWSSHQYGPGGELCLEFGPDNWHPDLTGADMIESAHRLLEGETPAPDGRAIVASRHATTMGQDLRGRRLRLLVTRELLHIISAVPERTPMAGKLFGVYHEEAIVFAVTSLTLPDGTQWVDPTIPKPLKYEAYEREMLLVRWPNGTAAPSSTSAKELRVAMGAPETSDAHFLLIAREDTIYGYCLWDDDDTTGEMSAVAPQAVVARLDDGHKALSARKVAIVGCGSLGSKLAVMLARAGVGKFLLVDADIMLPDNLVRHELDWHEMGTHKAAAVARRIQLVNPSAECHRRLHLIGGQESSGSIETLIGSLAECDLIVDATADARAFGYLSAASSIGKKPVVWAEVFGGGLGGLIARHRPQLEPELASMRRVIENWCLEHGRTISHGVDYESRDSGPPLIADDADVAVIAAHAARLAIDTLIPRVPSLFPHSVYMIGLAQGWIFDQPFDTRPIDVGLPAPATSAPAVDPQIAEQDIAFLRDLLRKSSNAASADTANHPASNT